MSGLRGGLALISEYMFVYWIAWKTSSQVETTEVGASLGNAFESVSRLCVNESRKDTMVFGWQASLHN